MQYIRAPVAVIVACVSRDISSPMFEMFQITFCNYCIVLVWFFGYFFIHDQLNHWETLKFGHMWRAVIQSTGHQCHSDINISLALVIFVHHVLNSSVVRCNSTEKTFGWKRVHNFHYGYAAPATKSTVTANSHPCPWESCISLNTVRPRWYGGRFADDIFNDILKDTYHTLNSISLKLDHKGAFHNNPALVLWDNGWKVTAVTLFTTWPLPDQTEQVRAQHEVFL